MTENNNELNDESISKWLGVQLLSLTEKVTTALTTVRFLIVLLLFSGTVSISQCTTSYNQLSELKVAVAELSISFKHHTHNEQKEGSNTEP